MPRSSEDRSAEQQDGVAPTLGEVLSRVGTEVFRAGLVSEPLLERAITGVTVYDPLVELGRSPGHVLLAVGVRCGSENAVELVRRAAAQGYVGAVFHEDGEPSPAMREAAEDAIALLLAPAEVPWIHLATTLRVGIVRSPHEVGGVALGDLFGFANWLSAKVGGAVTIEDPQSQVLAYSSVREDVDEPRKQTILGRRVPQRYMRVLQEKGVFRRLLATDDVVEMEAMPEVQLSRRVAISVRAAGELLGSIWVAEAGQPLVDGYPAVLREASRTAALHIMRHRLELQAESNLRRSMVRDILEGTTPDVAAVRLALKPEAPYAVVAFESETSTAGDRLFQTVAMYCSVSGRSAELLDEGPRVYVVLTADTGERIGARRFATEASRRAGSALQTSVRAAVGPVVVSVDHVTESREEADRVMRVLMQPGTRETVAEMRDVRAAANLLEVLDLLRTRAHLREGPLSRLAEEAGRGDVFVGTIRAYLDHLGDVPAAAASMNVHPNTFRYRLRRAAEVTGVDLDDPTERLMLSLQLRLQP